MAPLFSFSVLTCTTFLPKIILPRPATFSYANNVFNSHNRCFKSSISLCVCILAAAFYWCQQRCASWFPLSRTSTKADSSLSSELDSLPVAFQGTSGLAGPPYCCYILVNLCLHYPIRQTEHLNVHRMSGIEDIESEF